MKHPTQTVIVGFSQRWIIDNYTLYMPGGGGVVGNLPLRINVQCPCNAAFRVQTDAHTRPHARTHTHTPILKYTFIKRVSNTFSWFNLIACNRIKRLLVLNDHLMWSYGWLLVTTFDVH